MPYNLSGEIWKNSGHGAWYFVTLPSELTAELKSQRPPGSKGFGTIPVTVTLGVSKWQTSIFPDVRKQSFLLAVKKDIRILNKVDAGDSINYQVELREA